jgi:hypothetical protein
MDGALREDRSIEFYANREQALIATGLGGSGARGTATTGVLFGYRVYEGAAVAWPLVRAGPLTRSGLELSADWVLDWAPGSRRPYRRDIRRGPERYGAPSQCWCWRERPRPAPADRGSDHTSQARRISRSERVPPSQSTDGGQHEQRRRASRFGDARIIEEHRLVGPEGAAVTDPDGLPVPVEVTRIAPASGVP